jgi:hypothetical protein
MVEERARVGNAFKFFDDRALAHDQNELESFEAQLIPFLNKLASFDTAQSTLFAHEKLLEFKITLFKAAKPWVN